MTEGDIKDIERAFEANALPPPSTPPPPTSCSPPCFCDFTTLRCSAPPADHRAAPAAQSGAEAGWRLVRRKMISGRQHKKPGLLGVVLQQA